MPILIKKIDGSVISYLDSSLDVDFSGDVILIKSVVGEIGLEDYFLLTSIEGLTQDFSSVINSEFCETLPNKIGPLNCPNLTELNISY